MVMDALQLLMINSKTLSSLLLDLGEKYGTTFSACSKVISEALRNNNTIFWCGNGGSAAESSHLAVEFVGRFKNNRRSLPSISLNADSAAITCIANDFGYEEIFARQLEGIAKKNDVLVVLSTSGNSKNILKALQRSRDLGVTSIGLLGKGGGEAVKICDWSIVVNSDETARIQELHLLLGHVLCEQAEIDLGLS
jgi:D-sedoheptulose 7-phosphate isomerase